MESIILSMWNSSGAVVGFNLHFNTLAKTAIMGLYKR
jgi:hypothetical protein